MAAEAMFSCPLGADLNTRVNILGQHKPTPTPTPSKGSINHLALPCCDKPAMGINRANKANDAADTIGTITISRLAVPVDRLALINEHTVTPAVLSADQKPATNGLLPSIICRSKRI